MNRSELATHISEVSMHPALIAGAVKGLDRRTLTYRSDPSKWSIVEILAHLADMDVLYAYRLRQMIADKNPVIAPIDQDDWARNLGYSDAEPGPSLALFAAYREGNVRLLRRLSEEDLQKGAFHPELKRKVSVEEIIGMMVRHVPTHLPQIEKLKAGAFAQTPPESNSR